MALRVVTRRRTGDGDHHWWVMKGHPLRRPFQHPWRAARLRMMRTPQPHDIRMYTYSLTVFRGFAKTNVNRHSRFNFFFIRALSHLFLLFFHVFISHFVCVWHLVSHVIKWKFVGSKDNQMSRGRFNFLKKYLNKWKKILHIKYTWF